MKHIHYLLLSVLLAFSSCQNNEETVIENNFKGHYKITARAVFVKAGAIRYHGIPISGKL